MPCAWRSTRPRLSISSVNEPALRPPAIAGEPRRKCDTMKKQLRAAIAALGIFAAPALHAAPQDYRFEMIGSPAASGGKSIVQLRLVHVPGKQPVTGAVVFETKADMGPDGMPAMMAPARVLPEAPPGVYRVEVQPDMAGNYAISVAAKVQGESGTVRGSVTAKLTK